MSGEVEKLPRIIPADDFRKLMESAALSPAPEPMAWITQAGLDNWLKGNDPEKHVLLRSGGDMRVALFATPQPDLQAEVERLTKSNAELVRDVCTHARARGEAEGKLLASEIAGVVEGWRTRAETAEARVKELEWEYNTTYFDLKGRLTAAEAALTASRARVGELLEGLEEAKRLERQTFSDAAKITAVNSAMRDAINDLLTRPTDPAARQRARSTLESLNV